MQSSIDSAIHELRSLRESHNLLYSHIGKHLEENSSPADSLQSLFSLMSDHIECSSHQKNKLCLFCNFDKSLQTAYKLEKEVKRTIFNKLFVADHLTITVPIYTIVSISSLIMYPEVITKDILKGGVLAFQIVVYLYMKSLMTSIKNHCSVLILCMLDIQKIYHSYHLFLKNLTQEAMPRREILLEYNKNVREVISYDVTWSNRQLIANLGNLNNNIERMSIQELKTQLENTKDLLLETENLFFLSDPGSIFNGILFLLFSSLFLLLQTDLHNYVDARIITGIPLVISLVGSTLFSINTLESLQFAISKTSHVLRLL